MAMVSAIIPTWNRADLLQSLLADLGKQTRPPDEIWVIDNGSTDRTRTVASESGVHLIAFPENRGFAAAVNEGIRVARGDWLLVVNNDVALEPAWLEHLLAAAEETNASFAVGKLLRPNNRALIDGSWDLISRAAYAWRCGFERQDGAVWSARRKIAFAPMTAALFHRRVFELAGTLDTRFESYYEDVDLGIRCALAGLEGIYEPAAVALHMSKTTLGKSSAQVIFLSSRNQLLILAKYYSGRTLRRFAWPILAGQILALFAAAKQGRFFAGLWGKWQAIRRWRSFRRGALLPAPEEVERIFYQSEREIHRLQREIGFNPYWRLYFSLVHSNLVRPT